MIRHVVITGPESSGKTTLANALGSSLQWPVSEEVARIILSESGPEYTREDVIRIGSMQLSQDQQMLRTSGFLLSDTDLLTILIWLEDKFGSADVTLMDQWLAHLPDLYLLQTPDMPWQPDPLREDKERRMELFQIHRNWLDRYGCNYLISAGSTEERVSSALDVIGRP